MFHPKQMGDGNIVIGIQLENVEKINQWIFVRLAKNRQLYKLIEFNFQYSKFFFHEQ